MEVRIEDMSFGYGDMRVLHHIDLVIGRPGLVCIVGPNGVGKSTLVRCINKLETPDSGRITVDGIDLREIPSKELAKVMGYVPVASSDIFSMTVFDTVLMGRHPFQSFGRTTDLDRKIAKRSMKMMGVKHLALRGFDELSAGQHQKVAIARGLAQTPRMLILDEPTSNLDVRHQMQVTERLRDLAVSTGMTVLMISHDLNTSAKYADEMIVMALPGVIYSVGTPREVLTEATIRYVYGVDCEVVDDDGRPHVVLKRALPDEAIRDMHRDLDAELLE
ncbi:ABC transporter ATP-binding protein [Methanomassiliicoccaceae archaeon COG_1]|nr:ABC transporter ATP-binding protein [Methanomassiliicoccaceae archaeon COG_1]